MLKFTLLMEMIDLLLEDLGNLKFIDSRFLPIIISKNAANAYSHGERLLPSLGQNSPIKVESVKSGTEAFDKLTAPNSIALLFFTGSSHADKSHQMLLIARDYFEKEKPFSAALRGGLLTPESFAFLREKTRISPALLLNQDPEKVMFERNMSEPDVRKLITHCIKSAGKAGSFVVIQADLTRAQRQRERTELRRGIILTPKQVAQLTKEQRVSYLRSFKNELKSRVEEFKRSNVVGPRDLKELLNWIINHGYPEKVKVGNLIYNYYSSRLNFDYLRNPEQNSYFSQDNGITYEIDEQSAAYKEARRKFNEAYQKLYDELTSKNDGVSMNTVHNTIMNDPRIQDLIVFKRFTVILKLEGSTIVPSDIKFDYRI